MHYRILYLLLIPLFFSFGSADTTIRDYIDDHADLAIEESERSGIPASIKLAQALVESNGGKSILATRANNHFGIKCKSYWQGPRYFYTDDDRDQYGNLVPSCFRMYESASMSYRDHSDFLMGSERYDKLFTYESDEYEKWAKGLLECGYATDHTYARKLISMIERYDLNRFDVKD